MFLHLSQALDHIDRWSGGTAPPALTNEQLPIAMLALIETPGSASMIFSPDDFDGENVVKHDGTDEERGGADEDSDSDSLAMVEDDSDDDYGKRRSSYGRKRKKKRL